MKEFFIRHTKKIKVRDEDLKDLWDKDKIAIHFPGEGDEDSKSLNPEDYKKPSEKGAIKCLLELAKDGGYVWAESRIDKNAKIGFVEPGTKIKLYENARWSDNPEKIARLKTLQLKKEKVKHVKPYELIPIKASRPRNLTICRWKTASGKIANLVEGRKNPHEWNNLTTAQQEIACAEFLRTHNLSDYPKLKYLLLPPGRTLEDIDIFGIDYKGNYIYAQVTFYTKDKCEDKIKKLKKYAGKKNKLIFFCNCDKKEFDEENRIFFIPVNLVESWLKKNPEYKRKLFEGLQIN